MVDRILVTGANGFIGKQVIKRLVKYDVNISCLVRERVDLNKELKSDLIEKVIVEDLFDTSDPQVKKSLKDSDTIIHLAWYAEPGKYLSSEKNIDCLTGSINLIKEFVKLGGQKVIGVGTCAEYQETEETITIDTPLSPTNLYASCKVALFYALSSYLMNKKVDFSWCRLFYLYGEGEDKRRFLPYLVNKLESNQEALLTKGDQIRDFLDVQEAGRRIADVSMRSKSGVFNICSGEPITIREFAEEVARKYGKQHLLKFGARQENIFEPKSVVGLPNDLSVDI